MLATTWGGTRTMRISGLSVATAGTILIHVVNAGKGELRGRDLNRRPPGYGPGELPLLYPAVMAAFFLRIGGGFRSARCTRCLYASTATLF